MNPPDQSAINLGVLGHGVVATVDGRGAVAAADLRLDWMVGADDGWHDPAGERLTRQRRLVPAPVSETFVRVPGGDVVHRTYGAAAPAGAVIVVEVENASPVPLTVALVVSIAGRGRVDIDERVVRLAGTPVLALSSSPRAWAAGSAPADVVVAGNARTGPVDAQVAPIEIALLFPVPHRTCVRAAVGDLGRDPTIAVRDLPAADVVARGWERQLERGLQAHLPPPVGELVDSARADLLLASRRAPGVMRALEDWGFDQEAAAGWASLGWSGRRQARRRVVDADPWSVARSAEASIDPARFLSALRGVLVRERPAAIDILPGFPSDWLGQPVTVEAVPLRTGSLSFAVRWHGARPALLWEAPAGVELRAPALDPAWSSTTRAGEALLSEPPMSLLPMGTQERSSGEPVDAPGQFS